MTAIRKFMAPPKRRGDRTGRGGTRRRSHTGKLSLHVNRDRRGYGEPYRIIDGKAHWKFVYRDSAGWSWSFPAPDWQEAERLVAVEVEERRRRPAHPVAVTATEAPTFADGAEEFLTYTRTHRGTRPGTVEAYRTELKKHALPYLGPMRLDAITPADVTETLKKAFGPEPTCSARTWNKLATMMGMVFRHAVETDLLLKSPVRRIHRRSEKARRIDRARAITAAMPAGEQVEAFTKAALAREDGTSAGIALAVALGTGLRRAELLHLRVEDVTMSDDLADLHVAVGFRCSCQECANTDGERLSKNRRERYVPLTRPTAALIREQLRRLRERGIRGPWLFPVLRNRPRARWRAAAMMVPTHLTIAMKELATAAGITLPRGSAVHFARHVALSRWAALGLTQHQVDLASGHDAEGVRATYTHQLRRELYGAFGERLDRPALGDGAGQPARQLA